MILSPLLSLSSILMMIGMVAALLLLWARHRRSGLWILRFGTLASVAFTISACFEFVPALRPLNDALPGWADGAGSARQVRWERARRAREGKLSTAEIDRFLHESELEMAQAANPDALDWLKYTLPKSTFPAPQRDRVVSWVISLFENDSPALAQLEGWMLTDIFQSDTIPTERKRALFDAATRWLEAAPAGAGPKSWQYGLQCAARAGIPTDEQWERFIRAAHDFSLRINGPTSVRPGELVEVRAVAAGALQPKLNGLMTSSIAMEHADLPVISRPHNETLPIRWADAVWLVAAPSTPGTYTVRVKVHARSTDEMLRRLLDRHPPESPSGQEQRPIDVDLLPTADVTIEHEISFEVAGEPGPANAVVSGASMDGAAATAITFTKRPEIIWDDGRRLARWWLNVAAAPGDMAFDVVWRHEGAPDHLVGTYLVRQGKTMRLEATQDAGPFPPGHMEVVIVPRPELIDHAPGFSRVWGGRDVVLERSLRW